jgi:hypothetical protein
MRLQENLAALRIKEPSDIQSEAIPILLSGQNSAIQSYTGSGKVRCALTLRRHARATFSITTLPSSDETNCLTYCCNPRVATCTITAAYHLHRPAAVQHECSPDLAACIPTLTFCAHQCRRPWRTCCRP